MHYICTAGSILYILSALFKFTKMCKQCRFPHKFSTETIYYVQFFILLLGSEPWLCCYVATLLGKTLMHYSTCDPDYRIVSLKWQKRIVHLDVCLVIMLSFILWSSAELLLPWSIEYVHKHLFLTQFCLPTDFCMWNYCNANWENSACVFFLIRHSPQWDRSKTLVFSLKHCMQKCCETVDWICICIFCFCVRYLL